MSRASLVAVAAGLALAAALTYPTIVHPASMARFGTGDGQFSVWNTAWVAHALVDDPRHLFDANIFYPASGALVYSEANLVAGAIAAPVYAATRNPVTAHNVVVYAVLVAAFVGMWALVRRLTGNWTAALVPATGFAFCANVSSRTAEIQLLMVFVFPMVLLAFHRFADSPGWPRSIVLGLTIGVGGLASAYYGIFAGLAVGLAALWFAPGQPSPRRYWLGLAIAAVVAGALVAPVFSRYLDLRSQPGARGTLDLDEARGYSADWRAYLRTAARSEQWLQRYVRGDGEVLFPGVVIIALSAVGLATQRRRESTDPRRVDGSRRTVAFYAALTALAAWASLGPKAGLYTVLARAVPVMAFLRAPARLGILVTFGLAVIAGYGLAAMTRAGRRSWLAPALVVVGALEVAAVPWPLRQVPDVPDAYRYLATAPAGAVAEFHFPYRRPDFPRNTRYMFWSMWHWHPLLNGYSDYTPQDYLDIASDVNDFPGPKGLAILRAHRVRYVAIHLDTYNGEKWPDFEARLAASDQIRPLVKTGDPWLFELK
jgi:hypothetical protein